MQVQACRILIKGTGAQRTMDAHTEKLKTRQLDCGVDIFPERIRVLENTAQSPEDPAYDVLGLNEHRNLIYIHTGLVWIQPPQTYGRLVERSSTIEKLNGGRVVEGVIDAGYAGEIIVRVVATTAELDDVVAGVELCIEQGLAIAQMIPMMFFYPGFEMLTEGNLLILPGGRGTNGFGSTDRVS